MEVILSFEFGPSLYVLYFLSRPKSVLSCSLLYSSVTDHFAILVKIYPLEPLISKTEQFKNTPKPPPTHHLRNLNNLPPPIFLDSQLPLSTEEYKLDLQNVFNCLFIFLNIILNCIVEIS